MSDYNDRMRTAREAKGLSFEIAAARASRLLLPSLEFTGSTCRRTEHGDEEDADPVRLWALSRVYGKTLEELSPLAASFLETLGNTDTTGLADGMHLAGQMALPFVHDLAA